MKNFIILLIFGCTTFISALFSSLLLINNSSKTLISKDSCLDSGGRYDEKSSDCIFATNEDGSSPFIKLENCNVDKIVSLDVLTPIETLCTVSTISNYSDKNIIVIDKIANNNYLIRILDSVDNQKELYREEVKKEYDFTLSFSYFSSDIKHEAVIVLEKEEPILIGFLHRDSKEYSIIWKV